MILKNNDLDNKECPNMIIVFLNQKKIELI